MKTGIFHMLALSIALVTAGSLCAADAEGNGKKRPGGPAGQAAVLLQHADELGLTADQKAKLEEMAKGPFSILTEDQKKKAKDIITAARPGAGKKKEGDGDKKPEAASDKKPEDEAKKPADGEKKEDADKK